LLVWRCSSICTCCFLSPYSLLSVLLDTGGFIFGTTADPRVVCFDRTQQIAAVAVCSAAWIYHPAVRPRSPPGKFLTHKCGVNGNISPTSLILEVFNFGLISGHLITGAARDIPPLGFDSKNCYFWASARPTSKSIGLQLLCSQCRISPRLCRLCWFLAPCSSSWSWNSSTHTMLLPLTLPCNLYPATLPFPLIYVRICGFLAFGCSPWL
jgi:hypothetical protein